MNTPPAAADAAPFELLLFRLGNSGDDTTAGLFGINVLKVREIVQMPELTMLANSHPSIMGVADIRGHLVSVINLPLVLGLDVQGGFGALLVTEFARSTQAFAVAAVDEIVRVAWHDAVDTHGLPGKHLSCVVHLPPGAAGPCMAQVLDVEGVVQEVFPERFARGGKWPALAPGLLPPGAVVLAADDSAVARAMTVQALCDLGVPHVVTRNGREAWELLSTWFREAQEAGSRIQDRVALVLSDLEMPEMDGITLTRAIKADVRYAAVPVLIHSSLSGVATESLARQAGADGYLSKFAPDELGRKIVSLVSSANVGGAPALERKRTPVVLRDDSLSNNAK